ncbi:MAG: porin [Planctomycetota bacterium]
MTLTLRILIACGGAIATTATTSAQDLDIDWAYQAELRADTEARSSLLAFPYYQRREGTHELSETPFELNANDDWINLDGHSAFRYNANIGSETTDRDNATGFGLAQTQLTTTGTLQDFAFRIQLDLSDDAQGDAVLEDAWIAYELANGIRIAAGQAFLPVTHAQYRVDENKQLGASRSVGAEQLGGGRTQGVFVSGQNGNFEWIGSINDGMMTPNTRFDSSAEADFAVTGRGNYYFEGGVNDFTQASSFRGASDASYVGGVFHYQTGGETIGTVDLDVTVFGVDGQYKSDGWQVGGWFTFANSEPEMGDDTTAISTGVSGSYFFDDNWEGFAGWECLNLDDDSLREDTFNFLNFGANYFFIPESYAIRGIIDVLIALEEVDGLSSSTTQATGILNTEESGTVALRLGVDFSF